MWNIEIRRFFTARCYS